MITYEQSFLLVILICAAVVIGIGVIAFTALRRADKALGMDTNDDVDSQLWRVLLLDELLKILRARLERLHKASQAELKLAVFEVELETLANGLVRTFDANKDIEWQYKCRKCGWQGISDELVVDYDAGGSIHMCPRCGKDISLADHIEVDTAES